MGGYQIIDFKNVNFPEISAPIKFEGVYDKIEGTRKPIMITNFVFDTWEIRNQFVDIYPTNNGKFEFKINGFYSSKITVEIGADDFVTATRE